MICIDCLWKSKEQEASGFKSLCCMEAVVTSIEYWMRADVFTV
jgi:hypothetical protein